MKPRSTDFKTESMQAALMALYEANNNQLPPRSVVDAARDPSSPLHDEFEWDDDAAAEAYRLAQAGALVRRVLATIIKRDPKTKRLTATVTRQYQSRPSQRHRDGGYETLQDILSDEDKRAELIGRVLREMRSYRKRYEELVELQSIWSAIDDATEDSQSSGTAAGTGASLQS